MTLVADNWNAIKKEKIVKRLPESTEDYALYSVRNRWEDEKQIWTILKGGKDETQNRNVRPVNDSSPFYRSSIAWGTNPKLS